MESIFTIGKFGFLLSGGLYVFLLAIYFFSFYKGSFSKQFLLLLIANIIWSFLLLLSQFGASIPLEMAIASDVLRAYTWIYVLQTALGIYQDKEFWYARWNPLSRTNLLAFFLLALLLLGLDEFVSGIFNSVSNATIPIFLLFIFIIIGLLFVELLYRNTRKEHRHAVLYLCISAGAVFVYDLFVYSNALLLLRIDYELWVFRGYVNVLIVPALALAAVRNPTLAPELHVSREFVFHSSTLIGTGIYLFMMSLAGFYIKESSGEWGKILQILFLVFALALMLTVLLSSKIKLRIKRYLNTSFRNKYDYRIEWNRFSLTLLNHESGASIYDRVLQAIAQVVDSQGATLWLKDNKGYTLKSIWGSGFDKPHYEHETSPLIRFLQEKKRYHWSR